MVSFLGPADGAALSFSRASISCARSKLWSCAETRARRVFARSVLRCRSSTMSCRRSGASCLLCSNAASRAAIPEEICFRGVTLSSRRRKTRAYVVISNLVRHVVRECAPCVARRYVRSRSAGWSRNNNSGGEVRVPAHDGHDSGPMADTIPAAWRTVFRPDGGQFGGRSGTLSAMISERCPRSPARSR